MAQRAGDGTWAISSSAGLGGSKAARVLRWKSAPSGASVRAVSMTGFSLALVPFFAAGSLPTEVIPVETIRTPFCLVAESVRISVGKDLAIVEGDYDFRYVRRYDAAAMPDRIPFQYAVFVPKSAESLEDFTEITGARLHLGSIDFEPQDFVPVPDVPETAIQIAPADARIVILIFKIPRALLHQQCRLHISHTQPHYHCAGRTVAACLPLLPDFESLKNEFLFSRTDFTVEFEAVDAVRLHRLSVNQSVGLETPRRVSVHPVDRENIAVEVSGPAGK
jgi:hypothetical protein